MYGGGAEYAPNTLYKIARVHLNIFEITDILIKIIRVT